MNGVWRRGPGLELFQALHAQLGEVPILAEDLGIITKDVVQLRWVGAWQAMTRAVMGIAEDLALACVDAAFCLSHSRQAGRAVWGGAMDGLVALERQSTCLNECMCEGLIGGEQGGAVGVCQT